MSNSILNNVVNRLKQSLGQSRYHVAVHDCQHFLDVLSFHSKESFSHPWQYNVALTCSESDTGFNQCR
ncbi:hypothetical protein CBW52_13575 [Yersinia kristensenii]|uniref:Uncharacterized protein n=1 Tax=Yersinia kristensenii TaxID=28152 RepID=A0AB73NIJ3_YERKR|nr:hypothetical protein CBW52_13575 [Yersinia kristensenii]